jgi:fluoroacetyl-CoA thioesterase
MTRTKKKSAKARRPTKKSGSKPTTVAPKKTFALPRIGLEAEVEQVVPHEWTIEAIHPSLPPVLSTPAMIGLMEHATANAVRPHLPAGTISVGTRIEVDHLKAVSDGATVRAWGRLTGYEGRFLVFDVKAWSGEHLIGQGRVFRAIVRPGLHGEKAKARVAGDDLAGETAEAATSSR